MATKSKHVTMPSAEFQTLKTYLQAQGFSSAEIGQVIGAASAGRSRSLIAQILVSHLKTLPKKKLTAKKDA